MRRRNVHNAHERLLDHNEIMVFNYKENKGKWHKLFNNDNPIYLEIGTGKGKFIIELAKRNPNINYIGLEKYESVILQPCDRLKKEGISLPNLRFICGNADELLDIFDHNEIDKIYLNFSDPWPKAKHAKRRLTHELFLSKYLIINKGTVEFKTDNIDLFEYSLISLNNFKANFLKVSLNLHRSEEEIITTEYEDKFKEKGVIYFIEVDLHQK